MQPGTLAPDFTLVADDGSPYRLANAWANGIAVLVFFPGDDTAVCTKQLCEYRDHWSDFQQLGATIVGINLNNPTKHARFAQKYAFPFPLVTDPDGACCRAYGAKAWWGVRRVLVVIDRGVVRWHRINNPFWKPAVGDLLAAVQNRATA